MTPYEDLAAGVPVPPMHAVYVTRAEAERAGITVLLAWEARGDDDIIVDLGSIIMLAKRAQGHDDVLLT